MSGDLTDFHGTFHTEAGIIPRTLYRLFHTLDAEGSEYSIKVSYLELYNEELRDLLAVEEDKKVKMFEDTAKKVVIQGMEEALITTADEGVRHLRNGSYKRQVAATKCNDLSRYGDFGDFLTAVVLTQSLL
jgi:kinesin family member 11